MSINLSQLSLSVPSGIGTLSGIRLFNSSGVEIFPAGAPIVNKNITMVSTLLSTILGADWSSAAAGIVFAGNTNVLIKNNGVDYKIISAGSQYIDGILPGSATASASVITQDSADSRYAKPFLTLPHKLDTSDLTDTAPTISVSVSETLGVPIAFDDPRICYRGFGPVFQAGARNTGNLKSDAFPIMASFMHFGRYLEIRNTRFGVQRVFMNGKLVWSAATTQGTNSSTLLDFGSVDDRQIDMEFYNGRIYGFAVAVTETIYATPGAWAMPNAYWIADSWEAGTTATNMMLSGAAIASRNLGFKPCLAAVGGTGILNAGGAQTYNTRILDIASGRLSPTSLTTPNTLIPLVNSNDIVAVSLSSNDVVEVNAAYTIPAYTTGLQTFLQNLQTYFSAGNLVIFSIQAATTTLAASASYIAVRDAEKDSARLAGIPFVDRLTGHIYDKNGLQIFTGDGNWMKGTSNSTATNGTDFTDIAMNNTNHPTATVGHYFLAKRYAHALSIVFNIPISCYAAA